MNNEKRFSIELNRTECLFLCEALERTMHHYSSSVKDGKEELDSFYQIYQTIYDKISDKTA